MSYSMEEKSGARRLYITKGATLAKISDITGINERSLEKWSVRGLWPEKKSKYLMAIEEMEENKVVLKNVMIKKAIETQSTEDIQRIILFEILTSCETEPKRQLLDYLREIKKLTYQEIGNICGVSRQAIHSVNKGPRHTPYATAKIKYELARRNEKICEFTKRIKQSYGAVCSVIRGATSTSYLRHVIAEGLGMKYSDIWPDYDVKEDGTKK